MAMSANQADLMLTLYSGAVLDVPMQNPEQLQRLYFDTQVIRVRGVGNEFEKTTNDTFKGEREMSVCEMERNAAMARNEFALAKKDFQKTLALAKERKVKLSKEILSTPLKMPLDIGIGRAYCALLEKTKVKALTAQIPAPPHPIPQQQDSVKARTDSIRAHIDAEAGQTKIDSAAPPISGRIRGLPSAMNGVMPGRMRAPRMPVTPDAGNAAPSAGIPAPAPGETPPSSLGVTQAAGPVVTAVIPGQAEAAHLRVTDTLRSLNRYDVEIQKKFALAAACFIFVLLGAPIALRFPRAGVGLTIGVSLVVFGLYYVGLIAGESLARRGIVPPVVSMWIANWVFGALALILLARMGKEAGSNRGGDFHEIVDNLKYRFRRKKSRSSGSSQVPRATAP
jgi:lipopolysaccharide export system permease protein